MVAKLLSIQHCLNPLHVYCRLLDRGIGRRLSLSACKTYEILLFMCLSYLIKTLIHCYLLLNRSCMTQEELRKR
jgi:hypothetical protein